MKVNDAHDIIKAFIAADIPLHLWGDTGVGKSTIVAAIGREMGLPVEDRRLATEEVSDLIGMPYLSEISVCPKCFSESVYTEDMLENDLLKLLRIPVENPEQKNIINVYVCGKCGHRATKFDIAKITQWARPAWFPNNTSEGGILFLDELNRAPKEVRQAVFQLVLDRKMHTHILPPGWRIVAAGNYADQFDVAEMDEAMLARFGHLDLEADTNAVCAYGIEHGWNQQLVDFLRANPTFTCMNAAEMSSEQRKLYAPVPKPRRWEMVDKLVKDGAPTLPGGETGKYLLKVAVTGLVGTAAAQLYLDYRVSLPTFENIATGVIDYKTIEKRGKTEPDFVNTAVEKIFMEMLPWVKSRPYDAKAFDNITEFIISANRVDLATGVLRQLLIYESSNRIADTQWIAAISGDMRYYKLLSNLAKLQDIKLLPE